MQEEKAKTLNARGEKALEDYKNVLDSFKVWTRFGDLDLPISLIESSLMATFCSLAIVLTPTAIHQYTPILFQETIVIHTSADSKNSGLNFPGLAVERGCWGMSWSHITTSQSWGWFSTTDLANE